MSDTNRSIFRANAVRRYVQGREKAVLPRLPSPATFIFLWILLGLLLAMGCVVGFTQVPLMHQLFGE